ncbi:MAG: hypothetical protein WEB03_07180 [Nitriliruptor sp.]|uniref:hypothetical protein n=1 Tax=Nitriliruptor sp. TaxID=2448056 RepID=UPI0034A040FC
MADDTATARTGEIPVGTPDRPVGAGYRRAVPPGMSTESRDRLRWLLQDPDHWVLRNSWERYLRTGDDALLVRTDALTQDQRIAAAAWLRQQRHAIHRAIEGVDRAPDGWIESLPMMRAFLERRDPTGELAQVPHQPAGPEPAVGRRGN